MFVTFGQACECIRVLYMLCIWNVIMHSFAVVKHTCIIYVLCNSILCNTLHNNYTCNSLLCTNNYNRYST